VVGKPESRFGSASPKAPHGFRKEGRINTYDDLAAGVYRMLDQFPLHALVKARECLPGEPETLINSPFAESGMGRPKIRHCVTYSREGITHIICKVIRSYRSDNSYLHA
jgi:hypothetical protein